MQLGTALAALAVGGAVAGSLLLARYWSRKKSRAGARDSVEQEQSRKELRRKRAEPHSGYSRWFYLLMCRVLQAFKTCWMTSSRMCREAARASSAMLRTESASSVGPRRKQPRCHAQCAALRASL